PHELINMASQTVGCLHDYQLTVEDAKKLYTADLLVINGLGSETFIEKAYEQNSNLQIIDASAQITLHSHEGEEADHKEALNDHEHVNDHI
ncbi:MAG: zinc ABC transporter substrate-binding protein, partial [Niameybacter sp.]